MTSVASQSIETIEFPCEEWVATRTPQGVLVGIRPIPGTWTLISGEDRRRYAEQKLDVKAFFSCPKCSQVGFISETFKPPVKLGDTEPLPEMKCKSCDLIFRVILKDWDKRRLYCACYETTSKGKFISHKEYLHAENDREAMKFFWAQHGLEVTHFIGIAPVIGFFLENPKDDQVLVV